MPYQVVRMREEHVEGAIDTVQQAFDDDPYARWIYNDRDKFSSERNRVSLRLRCHWGIKHGLFHVCLDPSSANSTKVLGVAMWMPPSPPSQPQTWSLYLSYWSLWLGQLQMNLTYGRGGLNVKRYWLWKEAQAQAQAELWHEEKGYYFCNIVTVLPEVQGRGVGRALMEEVLQQADGEQVKCYLESSRREPNVPIYERFGFQLVRGMKCADDGEAIDLYCMIRDPKPLRHAADL